MLYPNLCMEDLLNMTGEIICGPKAVDAFVNESKCLINAEVGFNYSQQKWTEETHGSGFN